VGGVENGGEHSHGGTSSTGDPACTLIAKNSLQCVIAKTSLQMIFCDWSVVAIPDPKAEGDTGRIVDALALKALAHPLRFRLLEVLLERGPSTASELGRQVGESSGSTSYHLRQLAEHGFIAEAPELGSARDRWWRAAPGGWTLRGFEMLEQPETRADATVVLDEVRKGRLERLSRWHADASRWGQEWVDASVDATIRMALTPAEMRDLRDELLAVVDRWNEMVGDRRDSRAGPTGSSIVNVNLEIFPIGDPPPTKET
jgi:DNA-binding transcriptional ArsR family regulator